MKIKYILLPLFLLLFTTPTSAADQYLQYKVQKGDWVYNILRGLKLDPLKNIKKTIEINPNTINENGNGIKPNTIINLPITQLPPGTDFTRSEGLLVVRKNSAENSAIVATKKAETAKAINKTTKAEPLAKTKPKARTGRFTFGLHSRLSIGKGNVGNGGQNFVDREVTTSSLFLLPGLKYACTNYGLLFGPLGEYKMISQDSANVDNVKGKAYNYGLGLVGYKNKLHLLLGYDFGGDYTMDKKTSQNKKSSFEGPTGLRFGLGYSIYKNFSISLGYAQVEYKKNKVDSVSTNLTKKLKYTNASIGLDYLF